MASPSGNRGVVGAAGNRVVRGALQNVGTAIVQDQATAKGVRDKGGGDCGALTFAAGGVGQMGRVKEVTDLVPLSNSVIDPQGDLLKKPAPCRGKWYPPNALKDLSDEKTAPNSYRQC